ncbi:hypothetical protein ACFL3U_04995 [Pseudomonadota bacterium]
MSENQNEPPWIPFVGIIICIVTFTAIFIGLKSASDFDLIPLIAITVVSGSIVATLLNAIAQAIINASLKLKRGMQAEPETAQLKESESSNDTSL